jgi:hypothetical protein
MVTKVTEVFVSAQNELTIAALTGRMPSGVWTLADQGVQTGSLREQHRFAFQMMRK